MSDYDYASLEVEKVVLHPQGIPSADDAVSKFYVDSKVDTAISNLVDSAPSVLDTLKEIATALGNDANLATTLANSISAERTERKVNEALLINQVGALEVSTASNLAQAVGSISETTDSIQASLTAEVSLRTSQKTATDLAIAQEEAFRISAFGDLNLALSEESSSRASADSSLGVLVASEEIRAKAVESGHQEMLDSLESAKLNKSGGMVSGELTVASTGSLILEDSYLYFGYRWRVRASADGSRIAFEHEKDGIWKIAVPFISSA